MKKLFTRFIALAMLVVAGSSSSTLAQLTSNYAFTTNITGSLTQDANGNTVNMTVAGGATQLHSTAIDDISGAVTNIGFTFVLMGTSYTQFSVSPNNLLSLGSTAVTNNAYVASGGTVATPRIGPMASDCITANAAAGGGVFSRVVGTAPNRCLVVQWINYVQYQSTGPADTLQLRLYETTGVIEFVYGSMAQGGTTTVANQAGFSVGSSANQLMSVDITTNTVSTSAFSSYTTSANSPYPNVNTPTANARRRYVFTPPQTAPSDPTTLTFSAVGPNIMAVNWVDNSTNEGGFLVTRATDAAFTQGLSITTVPTTTVSGTGGAYNSTQTGLSPNTIYYYKIQALTEGVAPNAGLTGNQATSTAPTYFWVGTTGNNLWSGNTSWNTLANGTGTFRTNANATTSDILIVDGDGTTAGATTTISVDAATINIGQFQVTSNTVCTLQSSSTTTAAITLTGNITGDEFSIGSGSTLTMNHTANPVSFSFSNSGSTGTIAGALNLSGNAANRVTTTGGTGTVVTVTGTGNVTHTQVDGTIQLVGSAATLSFASGSQLNINNNSLSSALAIPLATWNANANLNISGVVASTTSPVNALQAFGNITWNCPGQTGTYPFFTSNAGSIQGSLTVTHAGSGTLRLASSATIAIGGSVTVTAGTNTGNGALQGSSTTGTINIAGNLNINGGTFGTGAATGIVNVSGNTTIASGAVFYPSGGATGTNNAVFNQLGGSFTNNATNGITVAGAGGGTINFASPTNTAQTFGGTGTMSGYLSVLGLQNSGGLTISQTGAVNALRVNLLLGIITNSNKISLGNAGASAATVQFGLLTGTPTGVGNFDVAPTYNLGSGTYNIIYGLENAARSTGLGIPPSRSISALTLYNVSGLTISGGAITTGSLTFISGAGRINTTTANLLTVNGITAGAITLPSTAPGATTYVNGPMARVFPSGLTVSSGDWVLPVGKSGLNSFVVRNAITTAAVTITAEVFDGASGGNAGAGLANLNPNRYWRATIPSTGITNALLKLVDSTAKPTPTSDVIGASTTQTGTYDTLGATGPVTTLVDVTTGSPLTGTRYSGYSFFQMATQACTSNPTAGTTQVNSSSSTLTACPTTAAAFSVLNGAAVSALLTYQWQYSSAGVGGPYNNISGATSAGYTIPGGLVAGSAGHYRRLTSCNSFSATSTPIQVIVTNFQSCYCNPTSTCTNEGITNVTLNTLNTSSGSCSTSATGYTNYSAVGGTATTTLNIGGNYTMYMSGRVNSKPGTGGFWIDYNQSGTFETTEFTAFANDTTFTSSSFVKIFGQAFTVPATALTGVTRMRVRYNNSAGLTSGQSCQTGLFGEIEDYNITIAAQSNCSGTPTVTATASVTAVCPTTTIVLDATGTQGLNGYTYQWQRSNAGANTFTDISGATSIAFTATQTASFDYRVNVTCTNGGASVTSNAVTVNQNALGSCYCTPTYTNACSNNNIINNFVLNGTGTGINNPGSGCSASNYGDFTSLTPATLVQGTSYSASITIGSGGAGGVAIWIDYNDDGFFTDASERYNTISTISSNGTGTVTIAVPANANTGTHRMRVREVLGNSGTTITACANFTSGEVEDYLVNVAAPVACSGTPTTPVATATPTTNVCPTSGSITLNANNLPTAGTTGVTYQWQRSNAGANTYTNLAGGTTVPFIYTGSQAVASDYRLVLTCTNGGATSSSNAATVNMSPLASCYCVPSYTTGCSAGDRITNVVLNGQTQNLSNNSGTTCNTTAGAFGYSDHTAVTPIPDIMQGNTYTANVTVALASGSTGIALWIDYNDNGVFTDAGEMASTGVLANNIASGATANVSFTPSITAPVGNHRMRIRMVRNPATAGSAIDPCLSTYVNGEAEDYTINITAAPVCVGQPSAPTASSSVTTVCAGTSFTLSVTGVPTGLAGYTYQWQSSPAGAGTFANITGATTATYVVTNQTAATDYLLVLGCTYSGLTVNSNALNIASTPFYNCYCTTGGPASTCTNEGITNVTLNALNNSSAFCATPATGYTDYSTNGTLTTNLNASGTYTMSVSARINSNPGTGGFWIDYNQNGAFDASEFTAFTNNTAFTTGNPFTGIFTNTFTVPAGALTGLTRMRVRYNNSAGLTGGQACQTGLFGETEDYLITIDPVLACSGTPPAPTAGSSVNSLCSGGSFTLSATTGAQAGASGFTYQWQSSPAGANTFTNITGATALTYAVSSYTSARDYRLVAICTASGLTANSNTVSVALSPFYNCYNCNATSNCVNEGITNVTLNTLNNSSVFCSNSTNGYEDYAGLGGATTTTLNAGGNYIMNMSARVNSNPGTGGVWIDYNQNGTFEATEFIYFTPVTSFTGTPFINTYTQIFTVPAGALTGITRMRVRSSNSSVQITSGGTQPCSTGLFGETEDYLITIDPPLACSGTPSTSVASASVTTACQSTSFALSATGITGGASGYTYQWQSSPTGANTFTDITGATTTPYSYTGQTVASDYRLVVTCPNGGATANSNLVSVAQSPIAACYCTPTTLSAATYNITNFRLTSGPVTIINNSSTATTSYENFSAVAGTTYQGYTLTYVMTMSSTSSTYGPAIWIDFNDNGSFADAGEQVVFNPGGSTAYFSHPVTGTFVIPAGAPVGTHRMRILSAYVPANPSNPCTNTDEGQYEDYTVNIQTSTACSGTPATPTATTSRSAVCSGGFFTLNATGLPAASVSGISYQWKSSPAGANTFTNISGATNPSYTTSQTAATDYQFVVTCANGGGTATSVVSVAMNPAYLCPCASSPTSVLDEDILNVTFGTMSNSSTCSSVGPGPGSVQNLYSNYMSGTGAPAIPLATRGFSIPFSVQVGTCRNNYNNMVSIFIDWNQNGLLTDIGEQVYISATATNGPNTQSGTITVPAGATLGNILMRVVVNETAVASDITPCSSATYSWGETEDYLINVVDAVACSGTPSAATASVSASSVCLNTPFTLSATGFPGANVTGITYQWQSSPAGAGTFTNITGATSATYNVSSLTAATDYQFLTICGNAGGGIAPSNTVSVGITSYLNCYCTPTYATGCANGDLISNFAIGTFNNNSGATCSTSPLAFSDYTGGTQAQLAVGTNYTATLSLGAGGGAAAGAAIWIDYNDDGAYATTERYVTPSNINVGNSGTIVVAIPAGAPLGAHRMRVRLVRDTVGANINPCRSYALGETEEYTVNLVSTIPCSSPPSAPTATSSATSVCSNVAFTLSAAGLPAASTSGVTYQWQSSPAGQNNFANISGAFTASYTVVSGQTAATDYQLIVTCTNSGGGAVTSNVVTVNMSAPANCFCTPTAGAATTYNITNFSTTGGTTNVNNTSSGTTGYENFYASAAASAYPGTSLNYSMAVSGGSTSMGRSIWIDFNENGLFTDVGEQVVNATTYAGTPLTGSITIPAGTTAGDKRMRIVTSYLSNTYNPCSTTSAGQYEDYKLTVIAFTPCSGTPATPVASVSVSNVCPATSIMLSATNLPSATTSGNTYQWQNSPTGAGTFTNITGATTASYTFTGQTVASDYQLVVTCTNSSLSATSNAVSVGQNALASCYCTPTYNNNCTNGDLISNVVLNSFTNNSGTTCSGSLVNYTSLTGLSLTQGTASNVSVTINLGGTSFTAGVAIWVDYNDNGVFESTEKSTSTASVGTGATATVTITPSLTAPLGNHRMRVRIGRSVSAGITAAALDPCNTYANGETEDYTVNVTNAPLCTGTPTAPTATPTATTACQTTSITINTTGIPAGTGGFTYQWQSSPAGAGTFTNITGATAATYTFTGQTASTDYQLVLACTNSGLSVTSNVVAITQNALAACYCTPTTLSSTTYNITNFTTTGGLTNINRSSSATTNYESFTDAASAYQGATVNYTMTIVGGGTHISSVWIDLNENGVFTDAGEQVFVTTAFTNSPISGSFTIPVATTPGTKRMRVVSRFSNATLTPCASSASGQYEDYDFTVVALPACAAPTTQPTALNLSASSTTSISGSFTPAVAPGASNYLVVRTTGNNTAWNTTPATATTYVAGNTVGNGRIIAVGTTTTFVDNAVANNTTYTYTVYAYNNATCTGGPVYNTTSPLAGVTTSAATYTAISNGNWSSAGTWDGNGVPANGCNSVVTIVNGAAVTLDVNANVSTITINAGGGLTVSSNTLDICNGLANSGSVSLSGTGTLNTGTANTYNTSFTTTTTGGSVIMSGGTLNVKGQLAVSNGTGFVQTGGAISVDPGTATAFLPSGTHAFAITGGIGNSFTGGSLTIVNPPNSTLAAGTTRSVFISTPTANTTFGGTHTLFLGDGTSTQIGNANGFVVETYGNEIVPINSLVVQGGNAAGRWGSGSYGNSTSFGTHIKGNLTINAGSEFRTVPTAGNSISLSIGGNIVNNGTLTSQQSSTMNLGELTGLANPSAQTISGSGVFQNNNATSPAGFRSFTVKNGNGLTFNTGNDVSFSGTVTFSVGTGVALPSRITMSGNTKLIENAGAGQSGAGATNGWVIGFYQKGAGTGGIVHTYPVGGAMAYAPFEINGGTVGTAGNIWARATDGDQPNLASGTTPRLIGTKSVNRYWTVGGTAVFTTAQVRMNYVAADNDAGTTVANYKIGFYNAGAWTYPTVTGTPTTTQTGSTNSITTGIYGDFAVAEQCTSIAVTGQPAASTTLCTGNALNLNVTATGSITGYQWKLNGTAITGATNASYSVANVAVADAGTYTVEITGTSPCNTSVVTSNNAVVNVNPAVAITVHPATTTVCAGQTLTLSVTASNATGYQWKKGATNITGATAATYTVASAAAGDAGNYTVVVSGTAPCAAVTSNSATVTVNPAVAITNQPTAQTVCAGSALSLSVTASNAAGYQWYKDNNAITGATSATYTVNPVAAGDAGNYYVSVGGNAPCVSQNSNIVGVTVNPVPSASISGTSAICQGGAAQTITFTGSGATAPYIFTYQVNGGANQTVTSNGSGVATVSQGTATAGAFAYSLVSVKDASSTQCVASASGSATVTVEGHATVAFSPPAPSMACGGSPVQLMANITTTGTITKAVWKPVGYVAGNPLVGLYTDAAGSQAYDSTTTVAPTSLYAKNSSDVIYNLTVTTALCPTTTGGGTVQLTVTPSGSNGLANGSGSPNMTYYSQVFGAGGETIQNADCETIATVAQSGGAPISGLVKTDVYTLPNAPVIASGKPYVPRYYQITPENNAQNATGTITLYATNAEFKLYNQKAQDSNNRIVFLDSADYNNLKLYLLPDNDSPATVATRSGNLLISKESGTSPSGLPGTFTPGVKKALRASSLVWNSTDNRWEITFSTTGFSGFFLGGGGSGAGPLPVTFTGISASAEKGKNRVDWNVGAEDNVTRYEVEKLNGSAFETIGTLPAAGMRSYTFYDGAPSKGLNTYRVKAVDVDGAYSYSPSASVRVSQSGGFELILYPNPTSGKVTVEGAGSTATEATVTVSELSGRLLIKQVVSTKTGEIDISALPSGTYMLQWSDGVNRESVRVTKQ